VRPERASHIRYDHFALCNPAADFSMISNLGSFRDSLSAHRAQQADNRSLTSLIGFFATCYSNPSRFCRGCRRGDCACASALLSARARIHNHPRRGSFSSRRSPTFSVDLVNVFVYQCFYMDELGCPGVAAISSTTPSLLGA